MTTRASARAALWTDLSRSLSALELWEVPEEILVDIYSHLMQGLSTPDAEEGYDYLRDVSKDALSALAGTFTAVLESTCETPETSKQFWQCVLTSIMQQRDAVDDNDDDDEEASGGSHRHLLVALHLIIAHALGMDKAAAGIVPTMEAMEIGLMAAHVYLVWLQIPGGSAFGVFIPFLYREVLRLLHAWATLMYSPDSDVADPNMPRQLKRKQHQTRRAPVQSPALVASGQRVLDSLVATTTHVALQHDALTPTIDALLSVVNFMLLRAAPTELPLQILKTICLHQSPDAVHLVLGRLIPGVALRDNALPTGPWDKLRHAHVFHTWALDAIDGILREMPASNEDNDDDDDDDEPIPDELVLCVLQQLCLRIPDKSDDRKKVCAGIQQLLSHHILHRPPSLSMFLTFLDSYARHEKVKYRQFAVELLADLVLEPSVFGAADGDNDSFLGLVPLLRILGHRACDRVSTVRTKSIAGIAALLSFGTINSEHASQKQFASVLAETLTSSAVVCPTSLRSATVHAQLLALCRDRLFDDKTYVRRASLQVLEVLLLRHADADVLGDIHGRCADPSIIVRKQAMLTLTTLLTASPNDKDIQVTWNLGVLPLVLDPEATVQTSCLGLVEKILLERLLQWHKKHATDAFVAAVYAQLAHLDSFLIRFLQKAVRLLVQRGDVSAAKLVRHAIDGVRSRTDDKWTISWVLLDELACRSDVLDDVSAADAKVVAGCWADRTPTPRDLHNDVDDDNVLRILRVLCALAEKLPTAQATELATGLQDALQGFAHSLNLIPVALQGLHGIHGGSAWRSSLYDACASVLDADAPSWPTVERALQTMGDLVLLDVDDRASTALPRSLVARLQRYLLPRLAADVAETPASIRALAFVAVGKACLADEAFAKESITMFMRELQTSPIEAIRSNILLVLGDLCIRWTSVVDVYIPTIASSLLDRSHAVRRNTLLLFSQLLLQDYVKWKESLLHYFLRALVDPHEEMASLAQHILSGPLLLKTPSLFTMKFVEAVFVFNNVPTPSLTGVISTPMLQNLSLSGNLHFPKRLVIYRFLLQHMRDEQKLQVSMKLVTEVLDDVVDGTLRLASDPTTISENSIEAVLQDALILLSSPEIRLSAPKDRDEELLEAGDTPASTLQDAKRSLLSKMSRKNFIENVVPVVIGLKHTLQAKRSPVMRYLMHCIKELFAFYKAEVHDILAADPQLAKEVLYDLRQFEQTTTRRPAPPVTTSFASQRASLGGLSTKKAAMMTPLTRIQREHDKRRDTSDAGLSDNLAKTLFLSPKPGHNKSESEDNNDEDEDDVEVPKTLPRPVQQWNVSVESPYVKQAAPREGATAQTLDFADVSSDDAYESPSSPVPAEQPGV
ncbi:hypothetical protein SPRG_06249 [Saprolegnia parasitica CBS 223.65]|uniref:Condensin complex subunit 1 C-terminal domain-containing protein n=1 Tax=Saprolegnia parasitica (strain CBS 223.65) TaxID=695850 RepID=A0A067CGD4_SAPPC|nr:hypothetical protein SPRG_06249 [Saprolegnia parasitica CBS 223.65]KDO28200.1 hypothetical protein SPRG_06249 [Saprolegnia parasitica CBS 223.65]|eukprot:XP_012201025.1 hypothetical protein SPRG_06249 [Saprolegnia parasitica CBS 223.65]